MTTRLACEQYIARVESNLQGCSLSSLCDEIQLGKLFKLFYAVRKGNTYLPKLVCLQYRKVHVCVEWNAFRFTLKKELMYFFFRISLH